MGVVVESELGREGRESRELLLQGVSDCVEETSA
jgi:hypothetical protein